MIGKTLGNYRIVEQVGMGGMATVYKAFDPLTDRYVAIKILPEYYAKDSEFYERFRREAKAIAGLEHLHILPMFGYGEEDGIAYMVMRYLDTGTLADRIKQGPLPLPDASRILNQLASALDYAHQQGVIHRDVKPSNALLDKAGNAYLTDFGIAKIVGSAVDLTGSGMVGTPQYMSPEQCRGEKDLAPASDIYSLGVVLYEMVTGRVPFAAETPLAVVQMHLFNPLPLPRQLNPALPEAAEGIILRALAKAPDARYASCGDLAAAFAKAISAPAQTVSPTPRTATSTAASALLDDGSTLLVKKQPDPLPDEPTVQLRQPARRSPLTWLGGLVGIIAVAVAALLVTRLNNPPPLDAQSGAGAPTGATVVTPSAAATTAATPEATATDTADATELFDRGDKAYAARQYDQAVAAFSAAIIQRPDYADAYSSRAWAYYDLGKFDLAQADFEQVMRMRPDDASAYVGRGFMFHSKGDQEAALADYNKALQIEPKLAEAYVKRGALYFSRDQHDLAFADFAEAIKLKPDDPEVYNERGLAYHQQAKYDEAIADFNQALKLKPDFARAYLDRGWAYFGKGNLSAAIADHTQAITLNPTDADAYYARGLAYAQQEQYTPALEDYARALRHNPMLAVVYSSRADVYRTQGQYPAAISNLDKLIELQPSDVLAYQARGDTYVQAGQVDKGLADFEQAIKLDPNYADVYYSRGNAYLAQAKYEEAIADYRKALDLRSEYADLYRKLGNAYDAQKLYADALKNYQRYIELVGTDDEAVVKRVKELESQLATTPTPGSGS